MQGHCEVQSHWICCAMDPREFVGSFCTLGILLQSTVSTARESVHGASILVTLEPLFAQVHEACYLSECEDRTHSLVQGSLAYDIFTTLHRRPCQERQVKQFVSVLPLTYLHINFIYINVYQLNLFCIFAICSVSLCCEGGVCTFM